MILTDAVEILSLNHDGTSSKTCERILMRGPRLEVIADIHKVVQFSIGSFSIVQISEQVPEHDLTYAMCGHVYHVSDTSLYISCGGLLVKVNVLLTEPVKLHTKLYVTFAAP